MPFIRRTATGAIAALLGAAESGAEEFLPADDPAVRAFLADTGPVDRPFTGLDTDFIRVLEDVIDALIDKGVLRLTDLPADAQRKLLARKGLRRRLRNSLDLLGGDDVI